MERTHTYALTVTWTGNRGSGTSGYRDYARDHTISAPGKVSSVEGSSDPAFRGDPQRYSPEELLVAALSSCHMLWFLHLCADAGVVVTSYEDEAIGEMVVHDDGSGEFRRVTLRPRVGLADPARAGDLPPLHHRAHSLCFIARSVSFPVVVEPLGVPVP